MNDSGKHIRYQADGRKMHIDVPLVVEAGRLSPAGAQSPSREQPFAETIMLAQSQKSIIGTMEAVE
jgi:hypothetical protein